MAIYKKIHTHTNRQEWLKDRSVIEGIGNDDVVRFGSSEIATVTGNGNFESKIRLFYRKLGPQVCNILGVKLYDIPSFKKSLGNQTEGVNRNIYECYVNDKEQFAIQYENQEKVCKLEVPNYFILNDDYPFMFSSCDSICNKGEFDWLTDGIHEEDIPVELKNISTNSYMTYKGNMPDYYKVQLHQQMMMLGASRGDLSVIAGNDQYEVFPLFYDINLANKINDAVTEFALSILKAKQVAKCLIETDNEELFHLYKEVLQNLEPAIQGSDAEAEYLYDRYDEPTSDLIKGNNYTDFLSKRYCKILRIENILANAKGLTKNRLLNYIENSTGVLTENYKCTRVSKSGSKLFKIRQLF